MNLANLLSWLRVLLLVPLVALLLAHAYLPALGVFALASLLDWLDGLVARRLNQQSSFGATLDHIADKLLVCTTLICLGYTGQLLLTLLASLVVVGRDLAMAGMRELWLQLGQSQRVGVNFFGKCKTVVQMLAICLILLSYGLGLPLWLVELSSAAIILVTLASLVGYLRPGKAQA